MKIIPSRITPEKFKVWCIFLPLCPKHDENILSWKYIICMLKIFQVQNTLKNFQVFSLIFNLELFSRRSFSTYNLSFPLIFDLKLFPLVFNLELFSLVFNLKYFHSFLTLNSKSKTRENYSNWKTPKIIPSWKQKNNSNLETPK